MLSSGPEDLVPFPRFPRLKNLTMEGCYHESAVKISGPQLGRLKLYNVSVYRIVIVAPKLKFLIVHGMMKFSDLSLPSLYHADISLGSTYSYVYNKELLIRHVLSLYRGLSNVISLLLDSYIIQVLSKNYELLEQQPSTFTRLESLIVEADSLPHAVVNCFFKGTSCPEPKLEFL
ncbi:unnamed protein product [Linum tenue]|uniref:Uncharacterized protein n=1 Tax=Linum tenue TaxID=586396 RepID=A0AAV0JTT2_9ROSI|nr:unnamed protein product [Linum tenue]